MPQVPSIPSTYKDLIIHVNARSTTSATNTEVRTRFNADSGSNYAHQRLNAANTGTTATAATSQTSSFLGFIAAGTAPAGAIGFCEALVSAYTSTFNKSVFSLNPFRTSTTTSGQNDQTVMSTWIATATITSVEVFLAAGNFEAGSTITLYGRGGSNGAPDGIEIKDEGSSIDSNTSVVNFTGTVSATQTSPGEVQVDIPAVAKSGDTMTGPLTIDYAAGAQLTVAQASTGRFTVQNSNPQISLVRHTYDGVGNALIDYDLTVADGTSGTTVRFFRNTATTGLSSLDIYLGDGSVGLNSRLSDGSLASFVCAASGNFGIGKVGPLHKLDVLGDIAINASIIADLNRLFRLRQYTVATLPTVGTAGRFAAVTNASGPTYNATVSSGGAVNIPVYDNGTNWVCH